MRLVFLSSRLVEGSAVGKSYDHRYYGAGYEKDGKSETGVPTRRLLRPSGFRET